MLNQTEIMSDLMVEELSEQELELIVGGQASLIEVDLINNDILKNVNVDVNATVLGRSGNDRSFAIQD